MSNSQQSLTAFFVPGVGLSSSFDPYAAIGCARGASQAEIEAALSGDVEPAARAILASPVRRLAWHLLEPPEVALRASEYARALRDATARRRVAAHLLDVAIARETAGVTGPPVTELWATVDRVWGELARDRGVAAELTQEAESLGIPSPDVTAKEVLAAVPTELLPGVHAVFASATGRADHRAFHLRGAAAPSGHRLSQVALDALRGRWLVDERGQISGVFAEHPLPAPEQGGIHDPALAHTIGRMRATSGRSKASARGRFDPVRAYPWLFSWVDLHAKLVAVVGLSLSLLSGALLAEDAFVVNRRDSAYADFQAALTRGQRGDVLRAAQRFVGWTGSSAADYRAVEVAHEYRLALLQEITQATQGTGKGDVSRWLADARALEAWAPHEEDSEKKGRMP